MGSRGEGVKEGCGKEKSRKVAGQRRRQQRRRETAEEKEVQWRGGEGWQGWRRKGVGATERPREFANGHLKRVGDVKREQEALRDTDVQKA